MATNQTENLKLSQWLATDPVLRSDFNADNQKIDAAMRYMPRLVAGSYTGNGKFGEENPRALSFTFTPMLVVITADSGGSLIPGSIFINGQEKSDGLDNLYSTVYSLNLRLTWGQQSVSWYAPEGADKQLNVQGQIYRYFALGF